jgi:DNA-binding transcriptional LysR family regulator
MTVKSRGLDRLDGRLLYVRHDQGGQLEAELEFRQLEYFVAVAEELHFGRAATRMYITQPALSQAIAGLERTLDVLLFARTRQNVELTDAGAELLRHARGMLVDREEAVAAVRRVERGEVGVLRIGVALLAEHEVAPALAALSDTYPDIVLDRTAAVSERLLASVQDRALHAALVHRVPVLGTLDGVEFEVIRSGRLAALVSRSNPLADRESARLSDLADEAILAPPREFAPSALEGLRSTCLSYGGFEPKLLEASTSAVPLGSDWRPVVDGDAVALMPEETARAVQPDGAVAVPLEGQPGFVLALAWRGGNGSPVLDRFVSFIRAYSAEHGWTSTPVDA